MPIVHIIPPAGSDGDRHEEQFPDEASDEQILAGLTEPRPVGDRLAPPVQEGYGRLSGDRLYLDHPGTVVAVGVVEKKKFVEVRRLRGPAVPPVAA